jgi:hypothetical protein
VNLQKWQHNTGSSVSASEAWMKINFAMWKTAISTLVKMDKKEEWPGWPTWFSGFAFYHNRLFENLFVLGLFADTLLRLFLSSFWPIR